LRSYLKPLHFTMIFWTVPSETPGETLAKRFRAILKASIKYDDLDRTLQSRGMDQKIRLIFAGKRFLLLKKR